MTIYYARNETEMLTNFCPETGKKESTQIMLIWEVIEIYRKETRREKWRR